MVSDVLKLVEVVVIKRQVQAIVVRLPERYAGHAHGEVEMSWSGFPGGMGNCGL
jgi:hypothetical protein